MNQDIFKAQDWIIRMKNLLAATKDRDKQAFIQEHIELLERLVGSAK